MFFLLISILLIILGCALWVYASKKQSTNKPQLRVTLSTGNEVDDKPSIKRANQSSGFIYNPEYGNGTVPSVQRPLSFAAIDFETATNSRMACQLGIVIVEDGVITIEKEFLIQPPENHYDRSCVSVHHILPSMTADAPTFKDLWPEISKLLKGRVIAAHNLNFDMDVLDRNMGYYDIEPIDIPASFCTCMDLDKIDLYSACKYFNIPMGKHHSALDDARACAKLALAYRDIAGKSISIPKFEEKREREEGASETTSTASDGESNLNESLSGRTVVISGVFKNWPDREDLKERLRSKGARVTSSLSSKTDYLIIGEMPGPSKIQKAQELCIPIINGEDL